MIIDSFCATNVVTPDFHVDVFIGMYSFLVLGSKSEPQESNDNNTRGFIIISNSKEPPTLYLILNFYHLIIISNFIFPNFESFVPFFSGFAK